VVASTDKTPLECPCPNCPSPSDCDGQAEVERLRKLVEEVREDAEAQGDRAYELQAKVERLREALVEAQPYVGFAPKDRRRAEVARMIKDALEEVE
jgi:hypothetical protein